ncbi:MAG: lipopolysaccharide transport periplasmic protein LptA [Azoarcus sp.]|jgi:lipopolysaccharide export system protein LptA|nr:lipopolysaccharide transport periplasmic protein LptA [Azoarcus sp.]
MTKSSPFLILAAFLALAPLTAHAERADREQPINIEADKVTVDDRNRTHTFDGNVVLTQGTLELRGAKIVVVQGADGFQTGVATAAEGELANFRQKREGVDEYVEGEAERIEYDGRNETATLFRRAQVRAGGDVVRGDVIEYDALTENYTAHRLPAEGSGDSRIRVTIQPKTSGS